MQQDNTAVTSDSKLTFGWSLANPTAHLSKSHLYALIALAIIAIIVGVNVEIRGALIHTRHTDAGVYFSAAWAVRTGSDPYAATDQNGWHLMYPPLLAVLLAPLADAPPGMHRYWLIPYAFSIGIWYLLSIAFLIVGMDQLAKALLSAIGEQEANQLASASNNLSPEQAMRRWSWRWWVLFFWPIALCVPALCRSVIRGQVGPLWLVLICMTMVSIIRRQPLRAGLWLAGAVCVKLIPMFLLLYPLYRRSWRMLAGTVIGLILGLVVIPVIAMGPHEYVVANSHYLNSTVLPGLMGHRLDPIIEHELINPVTSDTQSFVSVLMNAGNIFFGTERSYTPPMFARVGQWLIAGPMILAMLWAAGWTRRSFDALNEALFFSLLSIILLPLSPACHPHYFMMMMPLIAAVLATFLGARGQDKVRAGWIALLAAVPVSHVLTGAPGQPWIQFLRDTGLVTWVAMAFCIAGTVLLYRRVRGLAPFKLPSFPASMPATSAMPA
jgi:hypothetical protein